MRATLGRVFLWLALLSLLAPAPVLANPQGGVVVAGNANISYSGTSANISAHSAQTIIDWATFNISTGQNTSFHFLSGAGAASSVLNEVSASAGPSLINGLLNSYVGAGNSTIGGNVYVLNPNGILFGQQGSVNVGSFVGTTLSINHQSFLQGATLTLGGDSAAANSTALIQNLGTINALGGDIFLVAHQVQNEGTLNGRNVGLGAGSTVQLTQAGLPGGQHLSILAGNPTTPAATGVANSGAISAVTAELKAAGGNIYALAINNSGVVRANSLTSRGGHIYLTANGGNIQNSGVLNASGASGNGGSVIIAGGHNASAPATVVNSGTIEAQGGGSAGNGGFVAVTGDHVSLTSDSTVNVSGQSQGGTAFIGGGPHGADASVQDAQQTTIASGANILANGGTSGNGGKVVAWSLDTSFEGNISAEGGSASGNGGSVEVSGDTLAFNGSVNTLAPHGKMGSLLLDPQDLTVASGSFTGGTTGTGGFSDGGAGSPVTIYDGDINSLLSTANVTLYANDNVTLQTGVNITPVAPIGSSLSLLAGNSILFQGNATISLGAGGAFSAFFNYTDANLVAAYRNPGVATFTMSANSSITAPGGITIESGNFLGSASSIAANVGPMTLGDLSSSSLTLSSLNSISQVSGTSISATSAANISTSGGIGANTITLNNSGNDFSGTVSLTTTGTGNNATINNGTSPLAVSGSVSGAMTTTAGATTLGATSAGSLDISSSGDGIAINGNVTTTGSQTYQDAVTVGANLILAGSGISFDGNVAGSGAQTLTVNDSGSTLFGGTVSSLQSLTTGSMGSGVTLDNNVTTAGTQTYGDSITLGGPVTLTGTAIQMAGVSGGAHTLTLDNSGVASSSGTVTAGTLELAGTGDVGASGSLMNTAIGSLVFNSKTGGNTYIDNSGSGITVNGSTSGNLDLQAGGMITDNGSQLSVGGATTLASGSGNAINLGTTSDSFGGAVDIVSGDNVTIYDSSALTVNGTVSGTFTATGAGISDGGSTLSVTGATSLTAGSGNPINLGTSGDKFTGSVAVVSGDNVTLNDSSALTVNGTVSGMFTATGAGISDGGSTLSVTGAASLTAGSGNSINLGTSGDSFTGSVAVVSGDNVTLNDSSALTVNGTVSGTLAATGAGIGDGGSMLSVGGTTTLTAGSGNPINFSKTTDSFGGAVGIVSGDNVTIYDNSASALSLSGTVSGTLTATGTGITDGGSMLSVTGTSTLTAGAGNAITFSKSTDSFGGAVDIVTGDNVTISDTSPLSINGAVGGTLNATGTGINDGGSMLSVTGATTLTAGSGNAINLNTTSDSFGAAVNIVSGDNVTIHDGSATPLSINGTVSGTLTATGNGITDGGSTLSVTGTTTLTAGAGNAITFSKSTDSFGGAVDIVTGNNVTIDDTSPLAVYGTVSGNLTATGAGLSDNGSTLAVTGTSSLTATGGNSISMGQSVADNFTGEVTVSTTGAGVASINNGLNSLLVTGTAGGALTAETTGALTLGGASTLSAGSLTIDGPPSGINIAGSISTPGSAQTYPVAVTLTGSGTETLTGKNVTFQSTVGNNGNQSLVINDSGTTDLEENVNTGTGNQTYSAQIDLGGPVTLEGATIQLAGVSGGGNTLTLDNSGVASSSATVTAGTLELEGNGDVGASGSLMNTEVGNLVFNGKGGGNTYIDNTSGINVNGTTAGNLDLQASGTISDNGSELSVGGTTMLAAGSGNAITLSTTSDSFGAAVDIVSGDDVTIYNSSLSPLSINGTVSGTLNATGTGINDGGSTISVTGATTLTAGGGNAITFNTSGDTFTGPVSIVSGDNVTLNDHSALTVNGTVSGMLSATGAGISDGGSELTVGGTTTLTAGSGNPIALGATSDSFGAAVDVVSGDNVTIYDSSATALSINGTVSGTLNATGTGIGDGGSTISVTGATSLTAGSGNAITFSTSGDTFTGAVGIVSGDNVTLNDHSALTVNGTVSGTLAATGAGINDGGSTLTVGGMTTLTAGGGNPINLGTASDSFGAAVDIVSGDNVTVYNSSASVPLTIYGTISGGLTATGTGLQDGGNAVSVTGATSLTAGSGNPISFANSGDKFTGPVTIVSGDDVTLSDTAALAVNGTVSGTLTATGAGINDGGSTISVTGAASLTAGSGNPIDFGTTGDKFSAPVTIVSGDNVTLVDSSALAVNGTVSGTLSATGTGINDGGSTISVTGATSLTAGSGNPIDFGTSGDKFTGPVTVVSGDDVTLVDSSALAVNGTISGTLNATGTGINDGGSTISVTGATTLTAGGGNAITFNTSGDTFTGPVSIVSGDNVTLNDHSALTVNGTVSGMLSATGAGISDGGSELTVGGTTTLTAGSGNPIALGATSDSFGAAVDVVSGDNVTIYDSSATALSINGTVSGNLIATGTGIQDGGSTLSVGGSTTLTAGSGNAITFNTSGDTFTGAVGIVSGDNVTLNDHSALTVNGTVSGTLAATGAGINDGGSTLTVGGMTTLTAGGGNPINLGTASDSFGAAVDIVSGDNVTVYNSSASVPLTIYGTISGGLTATGTGIQDGGNAVSVTGATSLTAGSGNPISFANSGDKFTGPVTIVSGDDVTLSDTAALAVNGTVSGTLTATGAGINDGGSAISVTGATTLTAGSVNPIDFGTTGDKFTAPVTIVSGDNVTLVDSSALAVNGTVSGTLTATGAGINDGGSTISVTGATSLTAGSGNPIDFGTSGDKFTGPVTVVSGDDVTLVDSSALAVNGTVSGTLNATGTGINDGGSTISVTGATTLTAGGGNAITFNTSGDTFTGPVSIISGDNVTLNDHSALTVNGTVGGDLIATGAGIQDGGSTLTVGGTTTLTAGSGNPIALGTTSDSFGAAVDVVSGDNVTIYDSSATALSINGTVSGTLNATGTGIGDGGSAISVTGATTLTAGSGNAITFSTSGDTFTGAVGIVSGDNVTLNDHSALTVNGTVSGTLAATGAGINDGGSTLTVGGMTTLTAGGGNPINLGTASDSFGAAVDIVSGDNVTVYNSSASVPLTIYGTISGGLTATGTGIQDGGNAVSVTGATSLTAGSGNPISFANSGDKFTGPVTIVSGDDVTLSDTAALAVNGTVSGTLTATGAGINDGGSTISVTGATSLTAGSVNPIDFGTTGDKFTAPVTIVSGDNVTLVDSSALAVNGTVSGTLSATGAGISDGSSTISVTGATSLTAGSGNPIDFGTSGDKFTGPVTVVSGDDVTLVDSSALAVNGTVSGTLNATGTGINDGGSTISVTGATTLTAGGGNAITFNTSGDTFTGPVSIISGDNVTLNDHSALTVNGTVGGDLIATGAGIQDGGSTLTVGGTTTLTAGSGNPIALGTTSDSFGAAVDVVSGDNVTIYDSSATALSINGTVSGTLNATGTGIGDGGSAISVTGATTLTAGSGNAITFSTSGDTFTGAVGIVSGDNVTLNDHSALTVNGTVSGTLAATGAGINDGGSTLTVGGMTTLTAGGGNPINLGTASDSFGAAVDIVSGDNVTVYNSSASVPLTIYGTISGGLTATGTGIQDGGNAVSVTGATSLTAGSGNPISFANSGDKFTGPVTIVSGDDVTLSDTAALAVNGTVSGTLTATGAGINDGGSTISVTGATSLTAGSVNPIDFGTTGDKFTAPVTIVSGDNVTLVDSSALAVNGTVSGTLSATGAGISDGSSTISVTGATSLTAGSGNPIDFGTSGDKFTGPVTVVSGDDVTLVDSSALAVNGTVSGTLNATGTGINDAGSTISVTGATTLTAGGGNAITFNTSGDTFTGPVSIISGDNVTLNDHSALTVNGTVGGDLIATGAGIQDGGSTLTVGGTTTLTAGSGNPIALGTTSDSFGAAVDVVSGDNVTIYDSSATALSINGTVSGTLNATGTGIGDGGSAISVTGATSLTAGSVNPIDFGTTGDKFSAPVTIVSGDNVTLVDSSALAVNGTVSGTLSATGAGINDGGSTISVTGATSLTAGSGNPIDFGTSGDKFTGPVTVVSGDDVTLVDSSALAVNGTISGTLSATGAGISDGGSTISVTGATSLTAGSGNPINFGTSGDIFTGPVTIVSGDAVTLSDNGALTVNGTVGGDLIATGAGIQDGGSTLTVGGTTTLTAGSGNPINLGTTGDNFTGPVSIVSGDDVTLVDSSALAVNGTVSGTLIATGAGINDGGSTLSVTGATTLTAGSGNTINFGTSGDNFTGPVSLVSGDNVTIKDSSALAVNGTVNGTLNATGAGINDGGLPLSVTGATTLTAGSGNEINFATTGDNFTGAVSLVSGDNVTLVDSGALAVNGTVSGTLTASGAGISDGGSALLVSGTSSLTATGGNGISLGQGVQTDNLTGLVTVSTTGSGAASINNGANPLSVNGTVGGALMVDTTGLLTLGGSSTLSAGSLTIGGVPSGIDIAGSISTPNSSQTYPAQVTLTGSGTVATTLTGDGITFQNAVGNNGGNQSLVVNDSGTTLLEGSIDTGSGTQIYTGTVNLGGTPNALIQISAQTVTFEQTVASLGNQNLTISGASVLDGNINTGTGTQTYNGTVSLNGNGLQTLTGSSVTFDQAVNSTGSLQVSSATTTLANNVSTAGSQDYTGAVSLSGSGLQTLAGDNITFQGAVTSTGGQSLKVNDSGTTTLDANVTTTGGTQTYIGTLDLNNGTGTLTLTGAGIDFASAVVATGGTSLSVVDSAATVFGSTVGAGTGNQLGALTTSGTGVTINGSITTAGAQTYNDPMTLVGGGTLTLTGTGMNFVNTVSASGGTSLSVADSGATVFGNTVGAGTGNQLGALTTSGTGVTINGNITTGGSQTYNDPLTLGGGGTLTLTGKGIDFANTVAATGGASLSVVDSGATVFGNTVGAGAGNQLGALATTGTGVTINGSISTTGNQTYNDPLTVDANSTLNGAAIDLASVNGGGNNLSLNNTGTATLNGAVSGVNSLTAQGTGGLAVNSTVSAASVSDSETTTLSGGSVSTTGDQDYTGAITLAAGTTLSSSTLELASVTGVGNSLSLNNSGAGTANGALSGVSALTMSGSGTLTVNNTISSASLTDGEATTLNGDSVTTTGAQAYNAALNLASATTLSGTTVGLNSTVDGANSLTVNGTATLGAAVGGGTALSELTLNNAANLDGGSVKTTGAQNYDGAVTLGANNTLTGSSVTFASTVNGDFSLAINGTATFDDVVGGTTALTSLTANNAANFGGGSGSFAINTSQAQTYDGAVTLDANTVLRAGSVTFGSSINGNHSLLIEAPVTFRGAVGASGALSSLTLDDSALLSGGSIFTSGPQIYNGATTLGADTTMNASQIRYITPFDDGPFTLSANPPPVGPTTVIDDPATGDPVIIDNGVVILDLEGVIRGIFGTVAAQPAAISSVESDTSQQEVPPPPGNYLVRSGSKRLQPLLATLRGK